MKTTGSVKEILFSFAKDIETIKTNYENLAIELDAQIKLRDEEVAKLKEENE